ncbi:MAG: DUF2510 domain-containing protein [Micrococcales bacterium]|nr:DUF2510 domain-containing protein [Micrococcales bacterium]
MRWGNGARHGNRLGGQVADDVRVPAGWYPDPLGLPQLRWWDNHAWTEYTSDARQPMVAQETVTQPQQTRLTYAEEEAPLADGPVVEGRTRRERREAEAASDGARDSTGRGIPLAESLRQLEAPQATDQVPAVRTAVGGAPSGADTAAPIGVPAQPEPEEELSPAAKFAEFVLATPTAPVFDLDCRFDDLVADAPAAAAPAAAPDVPRAAAAAPDATLPPVAAPAAEPVPGTLGGYFAQTATPAGAFSYDYPTVTGGAAAAAAAVAYSLEPRRKNTSTGPVWLIAVFPLLGLFTALVMLASKITDPTGTIMGLAALVVPYLLGIPFAMADWTLLKRRGYDPAHWLWALATPAAYLIARAIVLIRTGGRGYGPLLGSAAFASLAAGVALAVPGVIIGLNPLGYSASIEQSVTQQAKALGADISVTCPSTPPTIVGDAFVCQATETGDSPITWGVTVSLQRSNGWISWRVDDWGIFMASNGVRGDAG